MLSRDAADHPLYARSIGSRVVWEGKQGKPNEYGLTRYTLCEYQGQAKRTLLRNDFDLGAQGRMGCPPIYYCWNRETGDAEPEVSCQAGF